MLKEKYINMDTFVPDVRKKLVEYFSDEEEAISALELFDHYGEYSQIKTPHDLVSYLRISNWMYIKLMLDFLDSEDFFGRWGWANYFKFEES